MANTPGSRNPIASHGPRGRRLRRLLRRNRGVIAIALVAVLVSTGTAAAASYLVLSTTNTASTTTTLRSAVNGTVLSIQNTNSTGGTSARGLSITVPAGRAPIVVGSTAGKATNLNADKLDGRDSTYFGQVRSFAASVAGSSVGDTVTLASLGGLTLNRYSGINGGVVFCYLLVAGTIAGGHVDYWTSSGQAISFESGTDWPVGYAPTNDRADVGQLVYVNYSTHAAVTVAFAVYNLPANGGCRWTGTMTAAAP